MLTGSAFAERIIRHLAGLRGTDWRIPIASAHVDGCLYHGQASLDFARALVEGGARVAVPTTLNVSSLDLLHPDRYRGDPEAAVRSRELMDLYVAMGCRPTWTCAPYQLPGRPALGQQIAWAESNAIVFANSVLGARTDRYGDFVDIAAAIVGEVPNAGLHRDEERRATVLIRLRDLPETLLREDVLPPVLGHLVGRISGSAVPVIDGLPPGLDEDRLKALGAAAASSGAVAMFHAVGSTPEAPTLRAALDGIGPQRTVDVRMADLISARDDLSTGPDGELAAVSIGTPHFSMAEFERLVGALDGERVHPRVGLYVNTGRAVLAEAQRRDWLGILERAGVRVVTDTCTYLTPLMWPASGPVMTNSAKWAFYAPGNLGVEVVFGSFDECVRSAVHGRVWRDRDLWGHAGR
jgi:predicted aconitase